MIDGDLTLAKLGLPQPPSAVITSAHEWAAWDGFPAYLKTPIGTATSGVRRLDPGRPERSHLAGRERAPRAARSPRAAGDVQSVFAAGELVAFHACVRAGEGARDGHRRAALHEWFTL
jgi:hypothetical protein